MKYMNSSVNSENETSIDFNERELIKEDDKNST
jgi:hypothetical protein